MASLERHPSTPPLDASPCNGTFTMPTCAPAVLASMSSWIIVLQVWEAWQVHRRKDNRLAQAAATEAMKQEKLALQREKWKKAQAREFIRRVALGWKGRRA